ncbi:MAG: CHASE3 domain-containing protein [Pseudomonadota bacterium]
MTAPIATTKAMRIWPIILVLAAVLAVVVVTSWRLHQTLQEVTETTNQRALARSGRLLLEHTLSLYKDMESGVRGFVITGQSGYLEPYDNALRALPAAYLELKEVLDGNLPDGMGWAELDTLMQQRLELLSLTITGRQTQGGRFLHNTALIDQGRDAMDRIRQRFLLIDDFQERRIAVLNAGVIHSTEKATRWVWIANGVASFFIVLAIYWLLRERKLRLSLEARLRQANADLESKVEQRTAALAEARDRIEKFALEQELGIERERRRVAREVHDQLGQIFTALKLIVQSLPLDAFPPGQEAALHQALDMGIASARKITADLRPPLLDDLGLAAALEHFGKEIARSGKLDCQVTLTDHDSLCDDQSLGLFRIVQEAVTNTLRHAAASLVVITGRRDGRRYRLTIADNGRGFDPASVRPGAMGLVNMRERAALMRGTCEIARRPEGGIQIVIELPLAEKGENTDHEHPAG